MLLKTQKAPHLWAFVTKLGKQKATLSRCNFTGANHVATNSTSFLVRYGKREQFKSKLKPDEITCPRFAHRQNVNKVANLKIRAENVIEICKIQTNSKKLSTEKAKDIISD